MAIDCRQCEDLLLDYLYGELDDASSASVAAHVEGCEACGGRARAWRETMQALDAGKEMGPGPLTASGVLDPFLLGAAESARQALAREMLLERAAPVPRERSPRRVVGLVLAAAAALLIVVGGYYLFVPEKPRVGDGRGGGGAGLIGAAAYAAEVKRLGVQLTVFNDDLAIVRDKRNIVDLRRGENLVRFTDVAEMIDPTSVRFESLTDPVTTQVLEQNYEFDLATPGALLKKFIDREIACETKDGKLVEGYLASYDAASIAGGVLPGEQAPPQVDYVEEETLTREGRMVMKRQVVRRRPASASPGSLVLTAKPGAGETSIVSLDDLTAIRLPEIPKGLLVKPTLVWNVKTEKPGAHDTTLLYQTRGFSWRADYVVTVGAGDVLEWNGWVTVNNNSGTAYADADLKLMAGEVHRVVEQDRRDSQGGLMENAGKSGEPFDRADKAFEEKAFFEYHLYTLSAPTTLNNRQTKQIKLLKADGVKAARRYVFDANRNASRALVELEVWNKKENQLGLPLPKGRVRFRQADPDGDLEYVGEDSIEHTPKDEKLTLDIGAAFDITGERVLRRESSTGRQSTQSYVITVRNHKAAPVRVIVREHPLRGEWAVTTQSHPLDKIDQNTIEFPVDVPANGETVVSYTIRYTG